MMDEREKVKRGLECCLPALKTPIDNCGQCPYYEVGAKCISELRRDALALLKEQEARVMTREEVTDLLQGSVVWYEEHSESGDFLRAMISAGNGFLGDFYLGVNTNDVDFKRCRFWSARPTDEQRKAVPWDE